MAAAQAEIGQRVLKTFRLLLRDLVKLLDLVIAEALSMRGRFGAQGDPVIYPDIRGNAVFTELDRVTGIYLRRSGSAGR